MWSPGLLMMHWWCTNDALMMHWWCAYDALIIYWWYADGALMMPLWYPDEALKIPWWCTDYALMMHWWCTDCALMVHWVWYDAHRSGFWPLWKVLWWQNVTTTTNRVNIEQSASGRRTGRVLQYINSPVPFRTIRPPTWVLRGVLMVPETFLSYVLSDNDRYHYCVFESGKIGGLGHVKWMSGGCLEGVWKVSGCCLNYPGYSEENYVRQMTDKNR